MLSLLALPLLIQAPAPTIVWDGASFTVRQGENAVRVEVIPPRAKEAGPPVHERVGELAVTWGPLETRFARDDYAITWDRRGLTVRDGAWTHTTRLEEIATSPRAQSREAILETVAKARAKERDLGASALTGFEVLNDRLYLLVAWHDAQGRPWLEALLEFKPEVRQRKPTFIGRLQGFTRASDDGGRDDRLFGMGGELAAITEDGAGWGLARWSAESGTARFHPFGERLEAWRKDGESLFFIERTSYGTRVAGELKRTAVERRAFAETRGAARWIATNPPLLRLEDAEGVRLMHAHSGRLQRFAHGTEARWTQFGVLAWTPSQLPTRASLLAPDGWRVLARWEAAPGR